MMLRDTHILWGYFNEKTKFENLHLNSTSSKKNRENLLCR